MEEVLLDGLLDSLKIFPFLFFIYVFLEVLERVGWGTKLKRALSGRFAPVVGSAVGVVPQCGFSVMCAKLYDSGLIRTGTLIAVFLSTSDEGLTVLITSGVGWNKILLTIGVKVLYAILIGSLVNAVYRADCLKEESNGHCWDCGEEESESKWHAYLWHPLLHACKVFLYVLIVNIAFGLIIYGMGEDQIEVFLSTRKWLQPFVCGLVGLIPNCSSSVILARVFALGGISFAGMMAGLCANAGIGLAVLFRNRARWKRNLCLLAFLYGVSVLLGEILLFFPL